MNTRFRGENVEKIIIDAQSDLGFNFPIVIYIPESVNDNPNLIYNVSIPRNYYNDCKSFEEVLNKTINDNGYVTPDISRIINNKGDILMLPAIPRVLDLRPGFFGRKLFLNDLTSAYDFINTHKESYLSKGDIELYKDLDKQVYNMIKYTLDYLHNNNYNVDEKIIVSGYSEAAKGASHFALLHPDIIKAVIAGGTGGSISMPVEELNGYDFVFPTGIKDLPNFDRDSFKKIKFFYYMAKDDISDSARPFFDDAYDENGELLVDECGNKIPAKDKDGNFIYVLDENGNYKAKYSLFSDEEVNAINKALGVKQLDRFYIQERVYKDAQIDATFKIYKGDHHTIFDDQELFNDLDIFYNDIKSK